MTDDIDHTLLASYLAGECSEAEAEEVRAWLVASPENRAAFQEFEALWRAAPNAATPWNVDTAWGKVQRAFREQPRLTLKQAGRASPPSAPRRFALARPKSWVAAAAVIVVGASAVVLGHVGRSPAERVEQLPMREVATAKGQRASVRLSDGTQVSLGVDSKLHFAPVFGEASRDVYLDGEAFFEVTHNPAKPFVVHAGASITRVLGTKFALRAYAGEPDVRVVVTEGKVRIRPAHADSSQGVVLTRNQLGQLTSSGRASVRQDVDVRRYLGWVDGRITFDDTPLREVMRDLEHWYDVDLVLADTGLDSLRLTVTFDQERLDVILRAITQALDLKYERTGSAILFFHHSRGVS